MLCPHCGIGVHLEQTGFTSQYETFYCKKCKVKYIAYAVGNGEFSEPVPQPKEKAPETRE